MRSNDSSPVPRVIRGGRTDDARAGPDRARGEGMFRPFLRPAIWTLVASVGLVTFTGIVTLRVVRSREAPPAPDSRAFEALRTAPLDAPAPPGGGAPAPAQPDREPLSFPGADPSGPSGAALAIANETERGHAGGDLSIARKRFAPCPGEDVERVAWIDVWSRIMKLTGTRTEAGEPLVVEQWFDRDGRLRAVRAQRGGEEGWRVSALLDERGATVQRSASGAAPALDALRLTAKNPSAAFFEEPRCDPGKR